MLHRPTLANIAISVPAFAIGGAVSRYALRATETRWQIAAFVALAIGVEGMARLSGANRASVIRATLNAATAAIVILLVKFHLEPIARVHDGGMVRHVAGSVVRAAVHLVDQSRSSDHPAFHRLRMEWVS